MRRLLKLQHHRHTGKLLPHRHTSYRVFALLLILVGVFLAWTGWSMRKLVNAEELDVLARVAAPIPSEPAVILHPPDGTVTNKPEIIVSGTCPVTAPQVSVVIYGNDRLLGSAICQDDGTFSLQVTLLMGKTTLIAKTLTITDDYGADSAPVSVTYASASVPGSGGGGGVSKKPGTTTTGDNQQGQGEALIINSRKAFMLFSPYMPAEWEGRISGGTPPYEMTINWGDENSVTYTNLGTEEHTFSHRYKEMRPYAVQLEARDSNGAHTSAVFAAGTPYVPPTSDSDPSPYGFSIGTSPPNLIWLYGGYLSLLCVVGALWLHAHHMGYTKLTPAKVVTPARSRGVSTRAKARHR